MIDAPDIVILAGGMATRFPGKLDASIDGEPMLQRVFRNASATGWPIYVSGSVPYVARSAVALDAPVLPDAKPGDGPLQAAVSACRKLRGERIALLAGDLPYLTAEALLFLRVAWQPGDEAVVAEHDGRFEPLAALYDRAAVLREGVVALRHGERSMRSLLQRIRKRTVRLPVSLFVNVNSPHELPASKPA